MNWQPRKLFQEKRNLKQVATKILRKRIKDIVYPEENYYYDRPASVYYLKILYKDLILYKIGYTSKSIKERINSLEFPEGCRVTVLQELKCSLALYAIIIEQLLHKEFRNYVYKGTWILKNGNGNTEIYSKDVLLLETEGKNIITRMNKKDFLTGV